VRTKLTIRTCLPALIALFFIPPAVFAEAQKVETFYVAPDGNDGWGGKLAEPDSAKSDGPFATIDRACEAARKREPGEKAVILVRSGTYELPKTLKLTSKDSELTIAAFKDEKPRILGGKPINGFEPYKGRIVKANVAGQGLKKVYFHQLFFEGQRQHLARYPNFDPKNPYAGGWSYVDGKPIPMYLDVPGEDKRTLHYKPGDVHEWAHPEDAQVFVFARYNWWNNLVQVKSIDRDSRIITLAGDCSYAIRPGDRYYVQNVLEELDEPGEWYLDKRTSTLYFWPPAPITPGSVYAPLLDAMIDIQGASHVTLRGFMIEACDGNAIQLKDCTDCVVAANTIRNVGGKANGGTSAVSVSGGRNCGVVGNDISYVGCNGISLSGGDRKTLAPADHYADNNTIHHVGVFYKQGVGIGLSGVGNRATRNLIHDGPRFGIMFSGNNLLIEYNHIHHVSLETEDTGAIYTGGRDWISSRGTLVRYNFFHDIIGFGKDAKGNWESPHFAWGIYLDDNTGGVDVIGNIVARCPRALIHLHNGRDNVILNNILIDGDMQEFECSGWLGTGKRWKEHLPTMLAGWNMVKDQPAWKGMRGMKIDPTDAVLPDGKTMTGDVFRHNIVYYSNPKAKLFKMSNVPFDHYISDGNVFWHFDQPLLITLGKTPEAEQWNVWKKLEFEKTSVVADPMFVDPAHDDYRLKPDSPALKLGFEPIPVEKIGPYQDKFRASWPIVETQSVER